MKERRVVITGAGGISPLGTDWESVKAKILSQTNAVKVIDDWADITGLKTRAACPAFCERLSAKLNELNRESSSVQQADSRFEAYSHQRHAACRNCEAFGWCRGQCPLESSAETPAMCRLMRIFASHMEPLARKLLDQGLYRPPMQYPNRRMLAQSLQGKRFIPIMQNC